jgi:hypothetical protein
VTHDITDICKASVFSHVGKQTPVAVRFSTVGGESGSADTARYAKTEDNRILPGGVEKEDWLVYSQGDKRLIAGLLGRHIGRLFDTARKQEGTAVWMRF